MGLNRLYLNLILFTVLVFGLSFLGAFLGLFYAFFILFLAIICFLFLKNKLFRKAKNESLNNWELVAAIVISLMSLYIFLNFSPSYLGGRDSGAMVEAAIMLSKNHRLEFSPKTLAVFDNQNSDQLALNYPGFVITREHTLKSQFNIGYVSFLSFWYSLLGEVGLKFANLFGIILGFLGIFYIVKELSRNYVLALTTLPLLFLCFPFFWQTRQNFSETLAFGLLFSAIYCLIKFNQSEKPAKVLAYLALLSLGCFTLIRIEGILILLIAILLLGKMSREKKLVIFDKWFLAFLSFSFLIFVFYSLSIAPFYKKMLKDLMDYEKEGFALSIKTFLLSDFFLKIYYTFSVFIHYGLFLIVLLGFAKIFPMIPTLLPKKKMAIPSKLIPLIIAGPFLVYFLKPMISLDHPWMLRRFMFACLPLLVVYSVLFIFEKLKQKKKAFIVLALMLLAQINIFFNYAFLSENSNIKRELEILSKEFKENDLILVDKSSGFNDWSLISEPLRYLFNKNSVYIYNPEDISRITPDLFSRIFLISSSKEAVKYQKFINPKADSKKFTLNFKQLDVRPFNKELSYSQTMILPSFVNRDKTIYIYEIK